MTCSLREWAPLTDFFNILPTKVQSGLFTQDIKLTSIDVLPEFLALGTNFGLVFWYDRKKKDIQKLRCEHSTVPITIVKIISTVDYMVACGNSEGSISIFQVPKSHHESLPENLKPKNKQVERYTVSELHNSAITSLEWSKNGMKLFSGDKSGHVVLTEIDFYMHICKSVEILNESYEVVQLNYFYETLLISTTYRSIICKKEDKWKISQVGKKDRKVLGKFGGIFHQNSLRPHDAILYCSRPGLRIWLSDLQGTVQQTLLFKDLLNKRCPEVSLINPVSKGLKNLWPQKEASFGVLLPFKDNLLVTYSNDVLYILNPKELVVNMIVNHLRGILSVAIYKNEIFILEGERSLIRLSDQPEPLYEGSSSTASNFSPITTIFKGISNKLQSSNIISAIPTTFGNDLSVHTDPVSVSNAVEAKESPFNTPIKVKQKIYEQISNQEYDSILFKQRKSKKADGHVDISSSSSVCSDDNEGCISKGTLMTVSTIGILPDLRSPDSIKHDIQVKEQMLADLLHLDKVKISCETEQLSSPVNIQDDDELQERATYQNMHAIAANPIREKELTENFAISSTPILASTPACLNIPPEWQLQNINISYKEDATNLSPTINNINDCSLQNSTSVSSHGRRKTKSSMSDLSDEWEVI